MSRQGRAPDELRQVRIHRFYTEMTPGSVLLEMGRTRVLCTVSFEDDVPPFLRDGRGGWVTAEYAMLPGSSRERIRRSAQSGGRTKEIQRLIGRSLRAAVDMESMGRLTALIDCDVLQADGGTRTAAITGAWVALADGFDQLVADGVLPESPVSDHVAAVSVGIVDGEVLLDLAYEEDVGAEVDCNVVMTGGGKLIEIQGTAEGDPFSRADLSVMLDLATKGIEELVGAQQSARGVATT